MGCIIITVPIKLRLCLLGGKDINQDHIVASRTTRHFNHLRDSRHELGPCVSFCPCWSRGLSLPTPHLDFSQSFSWLPIGQWIRKRQTAVSGSHTSHLVTCRSSCHLCNYLLQRLVTVILQKKYSQGFDSNNFKKKKKKFLSFFTWRQTTKDGPKSTNLSLDDVDKTFFFFYGESAWVRGKGGVGACLSWPPHGHQWVDYVSFCTT